MMQIVLAILSTAILALLLVLYADHRRMGREVAELKKQLLQEAAASRGALADLRAQAGQNAMAEEQRLDRLRLTLDSRLDTTLARTDEQLDRMRQGVETRLDAMARGNQEKLDAIRLTVDEKLTDTLNKRLGESFTLVNQRLEAVYKGLGKMQSLAVGVGDLKSVLTNVKTRGTWGEVQLDTLLAQFMAPGQYARSVQVTPGSRERVDFAVVLPGQGDGPLYLPIDSKFPIEDYQRIVAASESGDRAQLDAAVASLVAAVKTQARSIREKYVCPPYTTDFACMFLPVEGLYAEVLRVPGLCESIQNDCRVLIAGPTTISALLSSLQVGFRTLAIEKRTGEVWNLLGAVKTEFGKFADILAKTQKNLQQAANTIDDAARKTRTIERRLRGVEALEQGQAAALLGDEDGI